MRCDVRVECVWLGGWVVGGVEVEVAIRSESSGVVEVAEQGWESLGVREEVLERARSCA